MTPTNPNRLLFAILAGILFGTFLGGLIPEAGIAVYFLGDIFLRTLFVMVVPLVISSMIVGVSSLGDVRKLGPLGGRTVLFFMTTTGIAVLIANQRLVFAHEAETVLAEHRQCFVNRTTLTHHLVDQAE